MQAIKLRQKCWTLEVLNWTEQAEGERQSMDSQQYVRLQQNIAGGAKTQTQADDTFKGCSNQYADMFTLWKRRRSCNIV